MIVARIGSVENAEAVSPRLDLEKWHDLAVDAVHVPVQLLNPDRVFFGTVDHLGVAERAVVMEEAVLQHKWDLELTLWKVQRLLCVLANEIKASRTRVDVQSGDTEAVIVIPECGGGLAVRVKGRASVEFGSVFAGCCEPSLRVSVVAGQNTGAVKMGDIADRR